MKDLEDNETHINYARVPQAAPVQPAKQLCYAIAHVPRTPEIGGPLAL